MTETNMQSGGGTVSNVNNLPLNHVTYAVEVAEELGFDPWPLLQSIGLVDLVRDSGEKEVPQAAYSRLMEQMLQQFQVPAFGVLVGRKFTAASYGVLGYAYLSSPTLGDALRTMLRYQQILGSESSFIEELRVDNEYAVIDVCSSANSIELRRYEVEKSMGQWSMAGGVLANGKPLRFSRIHFAFPQPQNVDRLNSLLKCPLYFDQPASELYFPSDLLRQEFMMAEKVTAQLCEQQCAKLLRNVQEPDDLVEQVKRIILNLPGKMGPPEEVARQLNISYRTLRRRLNDQDSSFKKIQKEISMALAMEYLTETELSTQEIAFLLGYSEVSNFHRSFKKMMQCTPAEYRRPRKNH